MWAVFNYIDALEITKAQASYGDHSGQCVDQIIELKEVPGIRRQLNKIDPEKLKQELRQYATWDEDELSDHDENLTRILWIACGNINDKN